MNTRVYAINPRLGNAAVAENTGNVTCECLLSGTDLLKALAQQRMKFTTMSKPGAAYEIHRL
ncbi:MAG: hypothetical protein KKD96_15165 [Proteobacteria bacterium]|nr:hypothetical protein [Pseudomonadota bacterium]